LKTLSAPEPHYKHHNNNSNNNHNKNKNNYNYINNNNNNNNNSSNIFTVRSREPRAGELYLGMCPPPIRSDIGCFAARSAVCDWPKNKEHS